MNAKPAPSAIELDRPEAPAPVRAARAKAAKPASAPASGRFWFVFDQWLPVASSPEDEFVLA